MIMKYNSHKNRHLTDTFLTPNHDGREYRGRLAQAVFDVENAQLTDPALWALFVAQFRIGTVDDHDRGWRS